MVGPDSTSMRSAGWQPASARLMTVITPAPCNRLRNMLASKVIQQDVFRLYSQILQHLDNCCVHHGWSTHVELAILRCRVILQVVLVKNVVNESLQTGPVILFQRIGQRQMP